MPASHLTRDYAAARDIAASGRLSQISLDLEQHIRTINALRDQSAPEDVLEHYTTALGQLNTARRELILASNGLWTRNES